jgi:HemY protein
MIRAAAFFLLVLILAAAIAWLADRPGELAIVWFGYEVRTSPTVALILLVTLFAVAGFLWWLIRSILHSPGAVSGYFSARRRDRGYRALSNGLIAVGSGDAALALRSSEEARRLLDNEPLTYFLAAQTAQLRGDAAAARASFEAMLAKPETRLLGLHGLFVEARRQNAHEAARQFAERAVELRPGLGWAGPALLEYQSAASDWLGALRTLGANTQAKLVDKAKAKRLRAVLTTAQSMALESGEPDEARLLALEAHRLAPELVPAAVIAARLSTRMGDVRRATRIIEQTWKLVPHPDLATAYAAVRPGDSAQDRLKRMERLAGFQGGHREGKLALARAAIDARAWGEARQTLAELTAEPTERVCLLMAEIEQGQHGDRGRVRDWLARAVRAPRDPAWMADGEVFEEWAPTSPISGRLDAFEWRVPSARIGGPVLAEIEAVIEAEPPLVGPPSGPVSTGRPAAEPVPLRPRSTEPAQDRPPARRSMSAKPESVVTPVRPAAAPHPITPPRPPDDPGPDANGDEQKAYGRGG